MQTKRIGYKQKDNANKKDRMQTKKIMQTKRQDANKKDRMQTKNQNLSRCKL